MLRVPLVHGDERVKLPLPAKKMESRLRNKADWVVMVVMRLVRPALTAKYVSFETSIAPEVDSCTRGTEQLI